MVSERPDAVTVLFDADYLAFRGAFRRKHLACTVFRVVFGRACINSDKSILHDLPVK